MRGREAARRRAAIAGMLGWLLLGTLSCSTLQGRPEVRNLPVRHRAFSLDPADLDSAYREERDYVRQRRASARLPAPGSSAPLTGIALSGGGTRSSTFSMGVLQALERKGVLDKLDYMSGVSGGGYIAAWVQAHLGNRAPGVDPRYLETDLLGYQVGADRIADLLDNSGDHVEFLRFSLLRRDPFLVGPRMFLSWLGRYPAYVVMNLGLHLKGRYNSYSSLDSHKSRIEETYLRGDPDPEQRPLPRAKRKTTLTEMNRDAARTPYLVLNANLVNTAHLGDDSSDFEFTRDFVGSDALGYVPPAAFDQTIESVEYREGELRSVNVRVPASAEPRAATRDAEVDVPAEEQRLDSEFRLSRAAAASGAGFDPDGFLSSFVCRPELRSGLRCIGLRMLGSYLLLPFNLNLGYETENYTRGRDHWGQVFVDYLKMFTVERIPLLLTTRSRWIKITDGGHYDNTGIIALLRRGTLCIIAVDASVDPDRRYADLIRAGQLAHDKLALHFDPPTPPRDEQSDPTAAAAYKIRVLDAADQLRAEILYLKPNADERLPHLAQPDAPYALKVSAYARFGPSSWVVHWKGLWPGSPEQFLSRQQTFPHTSTFQQWFGPEEFEAYRLLGEGMAEYYLPDGGAAGAPLRCELRNAAPTGRPGPDPRAASAR